MVALLNDSIIRAELVAAFGTLLYTVLGVSLAYTLVSLVRHCRQRP
jgi:hypothetical protein